MKEKELSMTFMMVSNGKNPLISMVYTKVFQRFKGQAPLLHICTIWHILNRSY